MTYIFTVHISALYNSIHSTTDLYTIAFVTGGPPRTKRSKRKASVGQLDWSEKNMELLHDKGISLMDNTHVRVKFVRWKLDCVV